MDAKGELLLVVEPQTLHGDTENVLASAVAAGESAGFVVRRSKIDATDPSAAILIVPLPFAGLEGTLAVERVRKSHGDAAIVVLVSTGSEAVGLEALRRGADHVHPSAAIDVGELAPILCRAVARSDRAITKAAASAARYRAMVEDSPDVIAIITADGRTSYANARTRSVMGVDAVIGEVNGARIHVEDLPACKEFFTSVLGESRGSHRLEFRHLHPDGTYRWIEGIATNHLDDPAIGGIIGSYRDITVRKTQEAELREARRRLEFLLSSTAAVTYSCRTSGDFGATFMSTNVTALTGYEASQFLTESAFWFDRVHPEDQPAVKRGMEHILETDSHSMEYRFRRADGTYVWVHDALVVERDDHGTPTEFVGYWVDITTRQQAEVALRSSEARFRALTESSPMGVMIHRHGCIIYANPALVTMLGYGAADELIGKSSLDIVHPEDRAAISGRQKKTYGGAHTPTREQRLMRKNGTSVVVEAQGIHMEIDGESAAVVLVRDLTEQRDLLERLAIADRMLSVGTLAAGIAHEINNPLTYVLTNASMLSEDLPSLLGIDSASKPRRVRTAEEAMSLAREVHEGASRIRVIVRDLLSLARADETNVGPVYVRQVVDVAVKMAWNEIRHRARLVDHVDSDLPPILGNESRLVQLFLNLLLNAAQAIPDGHSAEHEIRVTAKHASGLVRIAVEDTGAGISPDVIGRVFDPFFTTKQVGVGTGLGLSMCHRIVKDLGGEIGVESNPPHGTRFHITLPTTSVEAVPNEQKPRCTNGHAASRLKVLAIDDQVAIGHSLSLLLGPEADVLFETRAEKGLARLKRGEHFDVIFCDLMMPEMNGMDFHDALTRELPDMAGRIVFLTGGAFTTSARTFLERVPNMHLMKPFDLSELQAALRVAKA